jgi:diguanylate cyclase (GGDEF)-like protein/PAS domain S-box-containing protein
MPEMIFQITPYAVICGLGSITAIVVAIVAWLRRDTSGGYSLTAMMIAAAIWAAGAALEYATIGIPGQIFWSKIQYFGTVTCPVLLLIFALEYNQMSVWLTRRNILLLFLIPLITIGLALTNEWHLLIWTSYTPSPAGNNITIYGHGIGFWIGAVGYSYLVMLTGTILLIRGALLMPSPYRKQVILVVFAALLPWMANFIYVFGLSPAPGLELTPLFIVVAGGIFAWAIFQFQLLDLVPIARDSLIETMEDGMLVLDTQNRVVDANPAARRLLGKNAQFKIGQYVGEIFNEWPEARNLFMQNNPELKTEHSIEDGTGGFIEISLSPVHDGQGHMNGQFIVMRDITERIHLDNEMRSANDALRLQLTEIESLQAHLHELAIRDSLTGLFNRRYLDETLERELSRARRGNYEISLMLIDLDHFKQFNDTYGHKAGDQVLISLGKYLPQGVREGDIVCRYGGEEFLVILPGVNLEDGIKRAEKICKDFSNLLVMYDSHDLKGTISIGVSVFPAHGKTADDLIRSADAAMYVAKQNGRNRVCAQV